MSGGPRDGDWPTGHVPPEKREPTRLVAVDDRGNAIGEDHPRAKLSDHEVELIRELYDPTDGAKGLSVREIAEKFEVSKSQVHNIVTYRDRGMVPSGYRRVAMTPGAARIVGKHVRLDFDAPENDTD